MEDLGSRNGTWVNGDRIEAQRLRRLAAGDELKIGSIQVVLGRASGLRRASPVADADAGEARLAAEVDRAVRYRRPVTFALVRLSGAAGSTGDTGAAGGSAGPVAAAAGGAVAAASASVVDAALDAIAGILRPMDLIADYAGDDHLVILPELDQSTGAAALRASSRPRSRPAPSSRPAPPSRPTTAPPPTRSSPSCERASTARSRRPPVRGPPSPPMPPAPAAPPARSCSIPSCIACTSWSPRSPSHR